jgi:hypothetical protein
MAPLLFYWKPDYYDEDRRAGLPSDLHQASQRMLKITPGESLWAFTRHAKRYVLAMELVATRAVTIAEGHPADHGRNRVEGNRERSRYFDVDTADDAEPVIRSLSIKTDGESLGGCFQGNSGVRIITPGDDAKLRAFAARQPTASAEDVRRRLVQLPGRKHQFSDRFS